MLLLVDGSDLDASAETRDWLAGRLGEIREIRIAGGVAAISQAVEQTLVGRA